MNLHGDKSIPQSPNTAIGKVIEIDKNGNYSIQSKNYLPVNEVIKYYKKIIKLKSLQLIFLILVILLYLLTHLRFPPHQMVCTGEVLLLLAVLPVQDILELP